MAVLVPTQDGDGGEPEKRKPGRVLRVRARGSSQLPQQVDPDADVLACVDRGDMTAAIQLLMTRYGNEVYRYCREELRDATLADDVHQQVFIQAHRDLRRFERRSAIRNWMFRIAHNRVLDAAKSRRRALGRIECTEPTDAPDLAASAGERIDDERLRRALATCLEQLGDHVRAALLLRFQQGFSYEEMAAICNEKAGTLQARVVRALPLLRSCIESKTGGVL